MRVNSGSRRDSHNIWINFWGARHTERIIGTFTKGDEVEVTVQPFRGCLLLVDTKSSGGVGVNGSDYEVVRDVLGKDVVINVLGGAGETVKISLASGGQKFSGATLDSKSESTLTSGGSVHITFLGKQNRKAWHKLGIRDSAHPE